MTDSRRPLEHSGTGEHRNSSFDLKRDASDSFRIAGPQNRPERQTREGWDDARLLAVLEAARKAPLPATSGADMAEFSRGQVPRLAKTIRGVPALRSYWRWRRRALWAGLSAAAAAAVFVGVVDLMPHQEGPVLTDAASQDPVSQDSVSQDRAEPVVSLRQVFGKVIATHTDGSDVVLRPEMGLFRGDELSTTAEAFASLEFDAGMRVDLSSATTLKVAEAERLDLRVGRVDVNVPKLPGVQSRRLEVNTPNAQVVVRGTIFSVEVESRNDVTVTHVGVTRGAVSVLSNGEQRWLNAGERWSSESTPTEAEASEVVDSKEEAKSGRRAGHASQHRVPVPNLDESAEVPTETVTKSSLARQNQIFERGLRARDQADDQRAEYWFGQLLRRFPDSPLAEAALRERDAARERLKSH